MSILTEAPSTLNCLLHDIGKDLDDDRVRYIKYLLQGHISKETLQNLESGLELVETLKTRGLVSEKRLAFLRKLLVEAKCLKLVNLVDEFKEKYSPRASFGERNEPEGKTRRNDKREVLLRMMERLENEITGIEETETESTNEVKQYEMQIQENNEKLASEEEEITKLKEKTKEGQSKIESFERKLETARFFLKKHEVEIDKIKQKLDESKNSASIKMELKEKMKEYENGKKDEDELVSKCQQTLDDIRSIYVEIRHRTEEIIRIEDCIHDIVLQVRIVKHSIHKNNRTRMELQEKLENVTIDLAETDRQKPMTPGLTSRCARSRLTKSTNYSRTEYMHPDRTVEYKVLDYNEISEQESTVIGRKGKGISPPQFNLPVSVAVDFLGHLHVADHGNGRVHVLDTVDGTIKRHPLNIGGKCRPCAVAVSHRGDVVMTDSQIIRVFNNKGEFLRPILPVYSKNDRRPHLCSVAIDNHGCIYVGDRANYRLQKFTLDGKFLHFIGNKEEINYPIGIAVTKHGDVIVSDYVKHHLKIFSREKTLEARTIGEEGIGNCKFSYPRGIALDHQENILVADSQNHRVQIVTLGGEYVGSFGSIGDDVGFFNTPYDVTVDTNGSVIVADAKNHRVQVFVRLVPIYSMYDNEIENTNDEPTEYKRGRDIEGVEHDVENGEREEEDNDASGSEDENNNLNDGKPFQVDDNGGETEIGQDTDKTTELLNDNHFENQRTDKNSDSSKAKDDKTNDVIKQEQSSPRDMTSEAVGGVSEDT